MGAVPCMGWGWKRFKGVKIQNLRPKKRTLVSGVWNCYEDATATAAMPAMGRIGTSAVWMTGGGYRFVLVLRVLGYVCYINN